MARLVRCVETDALIKSVTDAAKGENGDVKRGIRKALLCILSVAKNSKPARTIEYSDPGKTVCTVCRAPVGRDFKWCPECGALLDRALQAYLTDRGVEASRKVLIAMEKMEENT